MVWPAISVEVQLNGDHRGAGGQSVSSKTSMRTLWIIPAGPASFIVKHRKCA